MASTTAAAKSPSRPNQSTGYSTNPRKLFENNCPPTTTFQRIAATCTRTRTAATPAIEWRKPAPSRREKAGSGRRRSGRSEPMTTWSVR